MIVRDRPSGRLDKAIAWAIPLFKGALIVSAMTYVTITLALQAGLAQDGARATDALAQGERAAGGATLISSQR